MYTSVQYPDTIEPQVQFVEETAPEDIVEKTIEKTPRWGFDKGNVHRLCASSHPFIGNAFLCDRAVGPSRWTHASRLWDTCGERDSLEACLGTIAFLPVVQNVALANKHIHHPSMGPYLLPAFEPLDAGGVEGTKQAFFDAVRAWLC